MSEGIFNLVPSSKKLTKPLNFLFLLEKLRNDDLVNYVFEGTFWDYSIFKSYSLVDNNFTFSSHLHTFFSVFRSGSRSRWSHNFRRRSHPGFANYCQAWNYFDAWTNFTHEFFRPNCYVSNEESNQWIKNLWCCAFQVRWLDYRQFHKVEKI